MFLDRLNAALAFYGLLRHPGNEPLHCRRPDVHPYLDVLEDRVWGRPRRRFVGSAFYVGARLARIEEAASGKQPAWLQSCAWCTVEISQSNLWAVFEKDRSVLCRGCGTPPYFWLGHEAETT